MAKKNPKKNKKKSKQKESPNKEKDKAKDYLDNTNLNENNNNNKTELLIESKDIDFQKISKTIDKELNKNILSSPNSNSKELIKHNDIINNINEKDNDSLYKKVQNNYLKNNLNINIISMITQLINTSTTLPKELKNNYPLNNILLDITKELMFTDLEIVYFSLYLDNFGWTNDYYDIKDNLIITGLSVKKFLNKDIDIIENHLDKTYKNIDEKFKNWINTQSDIKKNISFSPIIVNERNNILKKPFNCYCRNNYIDYNDAVDKILQLSLPYNEINKHSKKNNKKTKNDTETKFVDLTYGIENTNNNNEEKIFTNIPSVIVKNNNNNQNNILDDNIINNQNNNNIIEKNNISPNILYKKQSKSFDELNYKFDKKESTNMFQDYYDMCQSKEFFFGPSFVKTSSELILNKPLEPSFIKPNNGNENKQ